MNDLKSVTPSPKRKNLTVNISKVKGDLDSPNPLNGSDFFSFISIGEFKKVETNKYYNQDEINPNWNVTELVENDLKNVSISIEVFDNDKNEWFTDDIDDELNINPNHGMNKLNLTYNQITGEIRDEITGQIYGEQGEVVKVKGSDDGNAGEIEFVIN